VSDPLNCSDFWRAQRNGSEERSSLLYYFIKRKRHKNLSAIILNILELFEALFKEIRLRRELGGGCEKYPALSGGLFHHCTSPTVRY
jgi:hypothetical protein